MTPISGRIEDLVAFLTWHTIRFADDHQRCVEETRPWVVRDYERIPCSHMTFASSPATPSNGPASVHQGVWNSQRDLQGLQMYVQYDHLAIGLLPLR